MSKNTAVRLELDLYERLAEYEEETGCPITRSVSEAVRTFLDVSVPPRLELIRSQRPSGTVPLGKESRKKSAKKMRAGSGCKYQNETQAAAG